MTQSKEYGYRISIWGKNQLKAFNDYVIPNKIKYYINI